jgi:two-component system sensor kinase FixL
MAGQEGGDAVMTTMMEADLLRAAVHAAQMGLWAWDIVADRVVVSTGWWHQLGEDDAQLTLDLCEWQRRIHPDDLAGVRRGLREYLLGPERHYRAELRLRHADGSWRWMLALASLVRDEAGQPLHMVGSHVDITEQKRIAAELAQANRALRESNHALEAAQRMGRMGHWEHDLQTGVLHGSEATYHLFGRASRPTAAEGVPVADFAALVHPADRARLAQATREAIAGGKVLDIEYRVVRPDGRVLIVHSQGTLEHDAEGRPRRLFGVVQDVTAWRQAEESRSSAERQLHTLIDNVPDFISRFDLQGRYLYTSGAVARTMGTNVGAVAGKTPLELGICADPESDRALQESLARVAAGGPPEQLEVSFETPSGPRPFEVRHVSERDEHGTVLSVLGIARDLGERKAAERQLYLLNYALDNVGEGIYLMEGNSSRFVYVNQGAAESLGYTRAELTGGMGIFDIDPGWSEARWEQFLPVIRERRRLTIETVHRTRGGVLIPVEVTGNYFEFEVRDITERRAAEVALRESELLYRSLVTAMAEGVVFQRADGVITAVNPAAERIEGRSAAEMVGLDAHALAPGAIREDGSAFPAEEQPSMVTLRTGAPQSNVIMGLKRPDGGQAWISINSQPLRRSEDAHPYAVVTTFHDITAQKSSELQLRTLAENSPDVILRFDGAGRCLYTNRAYAHLFGTPAVAPATAPNGGQPSVDGHPLLQALAARIAEVYASAKPVESEVVLALLGGEHTLNVRLIPETDDAGRLGSVLAVVRDVTEQKRFSAELAAREAHLRAVIETAVDAIITTDERGTILHANTATERIFGHAVADLLGKNVELLMNAHDAARFHDYLARGAQRTAEPPILGQQREVVGRRRDGSIFPAELSVSEFFVGADRRFTGMIRDISERKRIERLISEGELRLRTSVAYELHDTVGQLLAGGRFLAQNLVADLPAELRPRATRLVEILSDTLAKIRAFSKNLEVLGTAKFSFTQALRSLAEKISAVYEVGSRVELETQVEPPLTQRRQAYLVVEEAVANAIRHAACSEIVLRFASGGGRYRLTVEDDGHGIAEDRVGNGMGLTTMRYRAQLLGGSLEVVRRTPEGTSVILDWPSEDAAR